MTSQHDLTRHSLSSPFGQATQADFDELVLSMRERGYDSSHPITLYEGQVLDGWHRYLAAQRVGVEPKFKDFDGTLEEARAFVYGENLPRRHMTQRQKATALLLMNAWLPPREQLTDAAIAARAGLKSQQMIAQLRKIADKDPEAAQQVAAGDMDAQKAIRQVLHEEPADDREGTSLDNKRPEVAFTLRNKRLIDQGHKARLSVGMTKQAFINKSVDLFIDWAATQQQNNP